MRNAWISCLAAFLAAGSVHAAEVTPPGKAQQVCAACRVVELALGARAQGAALYLMARMLQRVAQLLGDGEHTARGGIFLQQQGAERGGGHGA